MTRTFLENTLNKKGLTITDIANELNVSTPSIYLVIRGSTKSKRIEAVLEEIFEMPIDEIRRAWNKRNNSRLDLGPIVERANRKYGRRIA